MVDLFTANILQSFNLIPESLTFYMAFENLGGGGLVPPFLTPLQIHVSQRRSFFSPPNFLPLVLRLFALYIYTRRYNSMNHRETIAF